MKYLLPIIAVLAMASTSQACVVRARLARPAIAVTTAVVETVYVQRSVLVRSRAVCRKAARAERKATREVRRALRQAPVGCCQ